MSEGLRWFQGVDENQIRTADNRYQIYRYLREHYPTLFGAYGPEGSQDIRYIQEHTAGVIHEVMRADRRPEDVRSDAGRALLGMFTSPDDARAACEEDEAS